MKIAKGKYISLLDDDDEFSSSFLSNTYNCLKNSPDDIGLSWCSLQHIDYPGKQDGKFNYRTRNFDTNYPTQAALFEEFMSIGSGYGVTIKASCLDIVGVFDTHFKAVEDTDIFLRILGAGFSPIVVPETYIRIHNHQTPRMTDQSMRFVRVAESRQLLRQHANFLNKFPGVHKKIYDHIEFLEREDISMTQQKNGSVASSIFIPQVDHAHADIVIFSPHPDDESIGCAGLIMTALAEGKKVRVVFFTYGDGYPLATSLMFEKPREQLTIENYLEMARIRQEEAITSMRLLGLKDEHLIFLGYPDSGLSQVYEATGSTPYKASLTESNATYGILKPDYHTSRYGQSAPYLRQSLIGDICDLLRSLKPNEIYITSEFDTHPDHQAAFWFVRDAINAAEYQGNTFIYMIHGGPASHWPWPQGNTPTKCFETMTADGIQMPINLSWPPTLRLPVCEKKNNTKLNAIYAYKSQLSIAPEKAYLESFIKSEEIFWQINL